MEENYVTTRTASFIAAVLALTVILSASTAAMYICDKIESLQRDVKRINNYSIEEPPSPRPAIYRISERQGKIAIYYPNGEFCETLDVIVSHLPKKDRELLSQGFNVYSMEEFASVIEDYTG